MFFDSAASNTLKFYNGSSWQTVNSGSGFAASGANSDITSLNALTAINGASLAIGNSATTTLNVGGAATGALTSTFGANTSTSTTTVQSGTGGLNLNAAGTAVITANRPVVVTPTALPGGNTAGMIAFDSAASNTLKYNNGAGWVTVANSSAVSGTTGYLSRFTGTGTVGNSAMFENSGNIGIGTTSAARLLQVAGAMRLSPTTVPASPAPGDMYIDSASANSLKYYNGSSWVTPSSAASLGSLGAIQFSDGSGGFSSTGGFNYDTTFDVLRISNSASPATAQTKLQISAPATSSEVRVFNSTTGTTGTDGFSLATSSADVRITNFESGKMFFGTAARIV